MTRLPLMIRALYQGAQLAKVETWKKHGVALAAVSGLLSALAGLAVSAGWLGDVPPQLIMELSSLLVTLVMAILGYLQIATTEKIGITPSQPQAPNAAMQAGSKPEPKPTQKPRQTSPFLDSH